MTLTAEDRESVQADLADERDRLARLQDVEPLKGLEGVRRADVRMREKYIARLEAELADG